ncbi:DsrE family protein [Clostridium sp. YIM B02515]|uniref:DsrE family protein n=1 Tax=Clostridium rhizosphaerae TaxID=2803861 RepID=A0ABS1TGB4_9CLOT|nr:DsrE family protein [Clostridium rhizosphaerae]MBL4938335.1 DsrE family protein [Clostridium rhizosphaerae]
MEGYKVIFHINESEKRSTVLANVNNLIKDLGRDNVIVEIVANGYAVIDYVLEDNEYNETINKMTSTYKLGVRFIACRNSLVGNKVDEESLLSFVTVVPSGVSELIKKQSEGYAYIKP